jgi:hypothetical protein
MPGGPCIWGFTVASARDRLVSVSASPTVTWWTMIRLKLLTMTK